MNKFVANMFLTLLGVIVAWMLFTIFFGQRIVLFGPDRGTGWKGAIDWMVVHMEEPISRYYYDYYYVPLVHSSDGVDGALGYSVAGYNATRTDLSTETDSVQQSYNPSAYVKAYWTDTSFSTSGWY